MPIASHRWPWLGFVLGTMAAVLPAVGYADPPAPSPTTMPDSGGHKLPHIQIDLKQKQVRVECEALAVDAPVEFFCCVKGTNDYESILRSEVKPSDLHFALLAIGLKPGAPITYNESTNKWIPPRGAPIHVDVEYQKDGKTVSIPAYRLMRDVKTKKQPNAFTWVFAGSRVMPDGKYAADVTGYLLSVCNFDLTVIDVPAIVSSANETLEWERDPTTMPKAGTTVWMVLSPVGADPPASPTASPAPAAPATQSDDPPATQSSATPDASISSVHVDQAKVDNLKKYWEQHVGPHEKALREAAQAHYDAINGLRKEQQRLLDEADRIQRTIDELNKEYEDMTTPHPDSTGS